MTPTQEETAVPETGKAITKYTEAHAHEVGLPSPQAVNYMFSIANMLYSSALIGKDMGLSKDQIARLREFGINGADLEQRDKDAVKSNAMAKMLLGFELNIEPMTALMELSIVKSKVFLPYPRLHKLIEDRGYTITEMERSETMAAIKLTHPTLPERIFEFTIEDAKRAGLTKRGGYNGDSPSQYELRPRVMLWARVISEAYRGTGGKGSVYTPEEKAEVVAEAVSEEINNAPTKEFKIGRVAKTEPAASTSEGAAVDGSADAETGNGVGGETAEVPASGKAAAQTAATEPSQSGSIQSPDKPTAKTVKGIPEAKVNDFLRGFLDVTKVPKSHPDMQVALAFLASLDPLTVLRDPFRAGADIHDYLQGDPIYGERMSKPDLHAFLRVLMRLPGDKSLATRLRESAMEDGQISKIVAEWEEAGMDLATCTPEDIESALTMMGDPFARMPE